MKMHEHRDVSANTSLRVGAVSTSIRIGTIVHTVEGRGALAWLQGGSAREGRPASADCLIERSGKRWWLSKSDRYSYHAGDSELIVPTRPGVPGVVLRDDRLAMLTMGVELDRYKDEVVTDDQVDSLAELICLRAPLYKWRWPFLIVGHYDVALPQGRRSDPVNFDWGAFAGRLMHHALVHKVPGITPGT